jgi:hypothetical protein
MSRLQLAAAPPAAKLVILYILNWCCVLMQLNMGRSSFGPSSPMGRFIRDDDA